MALPLKESQAIDGLAELFYNFLPWSGSQAWKGHVTFRTVAEKSGVGDFWQSGSKRPMIAALLEQTLEYRRSRFEPLILGIVRAGITYRHKQGNPVKPKEVGVLNGLLLEVGFKFAGLWDPKFHEMLRTDNKTRAKEYVEQITSEERLQATIERKRSEELNRLSQDFLGLCN